MKVATELEQPLTCKLWFGVESMAPTGLHAALDPGRSVMPICAHEALSWVSGCEGRGAAGTAGQKDDGAHVILAQSTLCILKHR